MLLYWRVNSQQSIKLKWSEVVFSVHVTPHGLSLPPSVSTGMAAAGVFV